MFDFDNVCHLALLVQYYSYTNKEATFKLWRVFALFLTTDILP